MSITVLEMKEVYSNALKETPPPIQIETPPKRPYEPMQDALDRVSKMISAAGNYLIFILELPRIEDNIIPSPLDNTPCAICAI